LTSKTVAEPVEGLRQPFFWSH